VKQRDVLDLLTSWFTPSHTRPNLSHLTIHQFGHRERPENGREKGTGIIVSLAETAGVREFLIFLCVLCELCERTISGKDSSFLMFFAGADFTRNPLY